MTAKTAYYLVRILQRLSLLFMGLWTIVLWIVVIWVTAASRTLQSFKTNSNDLFISATHRISVSAMGWAVAALVLTVAFGFFPTVRRNEKRLLVDSLIVIVFCFVSVAFCQTEARQFVIGLL